MTKQFVHPDNIVPDKTTIINGVSVKDYLIRNHNINNLDLPSKRNCQLKGVTIHNTLTLGKNDDGKWYTASTINGNMGGVFVHYYVDCNNAWHNLDDTAMNWSCSDGIAYAGGNVATIAIEVIMDDTTGTNNSKALNNAARLAAYILYQNGLTANDLYTHSYWINTKIFSMKGEHDYLCTAKNTRKNCPVYIIPQWQEFKKKVDNYIVALGGKSIYKSSISSNNITPVKFIYQAISNAAIRAGASKTSQLYSRVTKWQYYIAEASIDTPNGKWFKHTNKNAYSKLVDGGSLFAKVGEYIPKTVIATGLNVRSAPTIKSDKIAVLKAGDIVYSWDVPTVNKDGYNWTKIVIEGLIGYVATKYLK